MMTRRLRVAVAAEEIMGARKCGVERFGRLARRSARSTVSEDVGKWDGRHGEAAIDIYYSIVERANVQSSYIRSSVIMMDGVIQ